MSPYNVTTSEVHECRKCTKRGVTRQTRKSMSIAVHNLDAKVIKELLRNASETRHPR